MAEYIEREALLKYPIRIGHYDKEHGNKDFVLGIESVMEYAEALPAADVVEVRHGRWVGLEYDGYADGCPVYDLWECSECGEEARGEDVPDTHPWCHGCGSRMDGE